MNRTERPIGICCRGETATAGLVLASELRRLGQPVALFYSGKLERQFNRARREGANLIVTLHSPAEARIWFSWRKGVDCPPSDARSYLLWLADDADVLPEPPAYMLDDPDWFCMIGGE